MDREPFTGKATPEAPSASGAPSSRAPSDAPSSTNGDSTGIGETFHVASQKFHEVAEYFWLYIDAQLDSIRSTVRRIGIFAGLGVIAVIAAGAAVVTAIVLVCFGIAEGLSLLFGGRPWLGDLVTGVLVLLAIAASIYVAVSRITKASRKAIEEKYEARKRERESRYGQHTGN